MSASLISSALSTRCIPAQIAVSQCPIACDASALLFPNGRPVRSSCDDIDSQYSISPVSFVEDRRWLINIMDLLICIIFTASSSTVWWKLYAHGFARCESFSVASRCDPTIQFELSYDSGKCFSTRPSCRSLRALISRRLLTQNCLAEALLCPSILPLFCPFPARDFSGCLCPGRSCIRSAGCFEENGVATKVSRGIAIGRDGYSVTRELHCAELLEAQTAFRVSRRSSLPQTANHRFQ